MNNIPLIIDNAYGTPFPDIIFTDAKAKWNRQIIYCMSLSKLGLPAVRTGIVIADEEIIEMVSRANAVMSLAPGGMGATIAKNLFKTGEIIHEFVFTNTFAQFQHYSKVMRDNKVKPELEIYDFGGLYNVLLMQEHNLLEEPMHFQMVFGVTGGVPYDAFNFARMKDLIPADASWSVPKADMGPLQKRLTGYHADQPLL